jgi:hypothetical protein
LESHPPDAIGLDALSKATAIMRAARASRLRVQQARAERGGARARELAAEPPAPDTEIAAASVMAAHQISKQSGAEAEPTPQDIPTAAAVPVAALQTDVETSDAPQASVTTSLSAGNIVTEVPAGVASGVPGAMQEQTVGGGALDETAATGGSSANQRKKARRQGHKAKQAEQARAAEEAEMAKVRAERVEAAAIMAARRAASVARTSEVRLNAAAASSEAGPHQAESGRAAADDAGAEVGV